MACCFANVRLVAHGLGMNNADWLHVLPRGPCLHLASWGFFTLNRMKSEVSSPGYPSCCTGYPTATRYTFTIVICPALRVKDTATYAASKTEALYA